MRNVAGIILKKEGRFLLQLRDNKKEILNPNMWAFFGGGVEKGEEPIEGVIREVKEELNLDFKKEELRYITRFYLPKKRFHLYEAEINKEIQELELNEGSGLGFFSREEIIKSRYIWLPARLVFLLYFQKIK